MTSSETDGKKRKDSSQSPTLHRDVHRLLHVGWMTEVCNDSHSCTAFYLCNYWIVLKVTFVWQTQISHEKILKFAHAKPHEKHAL